MSERRKLFRALFTFMRQCNVSYESFLFRKKDFTTGSEHDKLVSRISRDLGIFIRDNLTYFQSFDKIIVYYDKGQKEINIINIVFNAFLEAEIRDGVAPERYSLFQVADMVCTLKMLSEKLESEKLTRSEIEFFHSMRVLKKNYLKALKHKRFAEIL